MSIILITIGVIYICLSCGVISFCFLFLFILGRKIKKKDKEGIEEG